MWKLTHKEIRSHAQITEPDLSALLLNFLPPLERHILRQGGQPAYRGNSPLELPWELRGTCSQALECRSPETCSLFSISEAWSGDENTQPWGEGWPLGWPLVEGVKGHRSLWAWGPGRHQGQRSGKGYWQARGSKGIWGRSLITCFSTFCDMAHQSTLRYVWSSYANFLVQKEKSLLD